MQSLVWRLKGQDAKVEAALEQLGRDLARRHPPDLDPSLGVLPRKRFEERQKRVHRGFVGADDHTPPAHLL